MTEHGRNLEVLDVALPGQRGGGREERYPPKIMAMMITIPSRVENQSNALYVVPCLTLCIQSMLKFSIPDRAEKKGEGCCKEKTN